jgi:hypothetical protein
MYLPRNNVFIFIDPCSMILRGREGVWAEMLPEEETEPSGMLFLPS